MLFVGEKENGYENVGLIEHEKLLMFWIRL
jgi:hypothetical protein